MHECSVSLLAGVCTRPRGCLQAELDVCRTAPVSILRTHSPMGCCPLTLRVLWQSGGVQRRFRGGPPALPALCHTGHVQSPVGCCPLMLPVQRQSGRWQSAVSRWGGLQRDIWEAVH